MPVSVSAASAGAATWSTNKRTSVRSRQATACRQRRDVRIRILPASRAPKKGRPRWPGVLTCGSVRDHRLPKLADELSDARDIDRAIADCVNALPAYSGGTVWESHPLRVAAGASVELSGGLYVETRRKWASGCLARLFLLNIQCCSRPDSGHTRQPRGAH